MPFQSEKQRRYLHANHPEIAKRWERDYAQGGILDINESEEIIDDGGNEIELTDYNAAFDDPNDFSTGVKSLFRAKEGGNVRLGPHKATDLLVKKTSTGERPKYQPPGHRDSAPSSSGPSGPPGGGATSMGSGRDYSPSPTRAPDFVTGVGSTKTTPSSTGGEWSGDYEDDPNMPGGSPWTAGDHHPTSFSPTTGEDEYGGGDYRQSGWQHKDKQELVRLNLMEVIDKNLKTIDPNKYYKDKYGKFSTGAQIIGTWMSIPKDPFSMLTFIGKNIKMNYDIKKVMEEAEKIGLAGGPPGTNDPLYDQLSLFLAKQKYNKKDEDPGGDGPIYAPLTGAVDEEYAQGYYDSGMSDLDRIRAGQAKYAAYIDKIEREKAMLANKGGLANLFRVKKQ